MKYPNLELIEETFKEKVKEKCPNNPSNGGSGVCNCILGQPHIT